MESRISFGIELKRKRHYGKNSVEKYSGEEEAIFSLQLLYGNFVTVFYFLLIPIKKGSTSVCISQLWAVNFRVQRKKT